MKIHTNIIIPATVYQKILLTDFFLILKETCGQGHRQEELTNLTENHGAVAALMMD